MLTPECCNFGRGFLTGLKKKKKKIDLVRGIRLKSALQITEALSRFFPPPAFLKHIPSTFLSNVIEINREAMLRNSTLPPNKTRGKNKDTQNAYFTRGAT